MAYCNPSDIINKAKIVLHDTTSVRWVESELVGWFNDGQYELVNLRPDANTQAATFTPTPNSTRQTLPVDGIQLINVLRNCSSSSKRAVRLVDRAILDAQIPDWHAQTAAIETLHYCYDELDPKVFWLYPQPTSSTRVEIVYSYAPPPLASTSSSCVLDVVYAPALLNYILYRAYSKDADYASNRQRMSDSYQAFQMSLGIRSAREKEDDPNVVHPERSPSVRG